MHAEIDAGEAQHRLLDHAQAGFHRRGGFLVAAVDGEIDRDVEHFRALGIVHAEEEDITPAAMGQVHADRRALAQDRIETARRIAQREFLAQAQRLVGGVAHAEHPLVAAHAAHAAADLVGQRLEREFLIGCGQGAGNPVARAALLLGFEKHVDGFLEAAFQQIFITLEGNGSGFATGEPHGQVEAVDGVEEKQRPNTMIEVVAVAAEGIEGSGFGEQFIEAHVRRRRRRALGCGRFHPAR